MNSELIAMFNVALKEEDTLSFYEVNSYAIKKGYVVEKEICNKSVMEFLENLPDDINSTFFKSWEDIESRTEQELQIEQILHYQSTYGTDFTGSPWVHNDGSDIVPFTHFKRISVITEDELFERIMDMLKSGIALKGHTVNLLCKEAVNLNKDAINLDDITNREAIIILCGLLQRYPNDKFGLLRYIIYITTDSSMIIKSPETINMIKLRSKLFDFSRLSEKQLIGLASIFYRFKELFLAFRTDENNRKVINKIRRMARKYHKPMPKIFWNEVLHTIYTPEEIKEHLSELTTFKKVALMQACLERFAGHSGLYIIRNQKMFVKTETKDTNFDYIFALFNILRDSLVSDIKKNAYKTVTIDGEEFQVPLVYKTHRNLTVTLPTSEKSYIGNYPFGTTVKSAGNTFISCYWRNEWGTRDYDLSYVRLDGKKIGWNAYHKDDSVLFSGDMTYADPEATEVLYFKKDIPLGAIKVNRFNGKAPSKFHLYIGTEEITNLSSNYMVNPNNIILDAEISHDIAEVAVGVAWKDRFTLMDIHTGNNTVSGNAELNKKFIEAIKTKADCFIEVSSIFKDAGIKIVDESYTGEVDIDSANLSKDSLINLMK